MRKTKAEITNPSEVVDTYWLYVKRQVGNYPASTDNCGKWLIFSPLSEIDNVWRIIKIATENGILGSSAKVATARPNPNAMDNNIKVICVYAYDCYDKEDVMRIREELRKLGFVSKIPYKTDKATIQGHTKRIESLNDFIKQGVISYCTQAALATNRRYTKRIPNMKNIKILAKMTFPQ